ncbi:General transcription factor II-I repeat domain-containing protein 2-like [Oopsacas minuta]|uniref:General transcription factor II-I repeat domain-containing protein 2-like n=1 Tax=Oopsacas minuta TaxID=111878 RepID=A0AAV7K7D6_9METZ|nr:General transcription factor II-I repeat domain-containing protein 2-like [Oopsacas minuta]
MEIVVKSVNFVKSRCLNDRQFQELLKEMKSEYSDLLYYCEVRWLSRGAMLKRVYYLKEELDTFMRSKGMVIPQFTDSSWLSDFAFLVDITDHLNSLNLHLQAPFDVSVDEAAELVQMELVDLQYNDLLKSKFRDCEDDISTFYQKYLTEQQFPELRKHAKKFCCLFGSTFTCEQLFSKMKFTKSITRTRLTDDHLKDVLRITTIVSISNFETLLK